MVLFSIEDCGFSRSARWRQSGGAYIYREIMTRSFWRLRVAQKFGGEIPAPLSAGMHAGLLRAILTTPCQAHFQPQLLGGRHICVFARFGHVQWMPMRLISAEISITL